jgi:general secretion pathway protein D
MNWFTPLAPIRHAASLQRLLLCSLAILGFASAQVSLTPIGTDQQLVLLASGPIRYQISSQDNTLLLFGAKLNPGQSWPISFKTEDLESGILLSFPVPYTVTRSADERRLQITKTQSAPKTTDTPDARIPLVLPLANAAPSAVAAQLTQLYSNLKIVIDERQRSLLIVLNPDDRAIVESIVKYLDTPRPQISFEAEVLEVNRVMTQNLGIDYDFIFKFGIRETDIPTPTAAQPIRFGRFSRDSALGLGLGATINLLQSQGAGRILARPRVVTLDGLEARINATQNTPLVITVNGNQTVQNIATGITLRMLPKVAPDNSVEVQVTISVSLPTGVTSAGIPTFSNREATTTVKVANGEPIVIGGLLESRKIEGSDKVPLQKHHHQHLRNRPSNRNHTPPTRKSPLGTQFIQNQRASYSTENCGITRSS